MDAVIDEFVAVHAVLLFEVGVEASFDVVENGLPPVGFFGPREVSSTV